MGIDTSGGMIVGAFGYDLDIEIDTENGFIEWAEDNGLDQMSLHYDSDETHRVYGYCVDDIQIKYIEGAWLEKVKYLATKFKNLTGIEATLIGVQDVT